ncbi:MFS transporter [Blastococcus saxobsidens]|uniref:Cyanate permease from the major facilitator family transporter n=1 Tax=Blastococcus saxobsidens (strain DD2) TaxID=1146883 RepID=H6RM27_BLASD|nr:MFS transporter [Blastococcus saxobsidens]CCG01269.1 Cyanate permease from the major facilitator family transporter [Blastococcus saxobsidens DD2]
MAPGTEAQQVPGTRRSGWLLVLPAVALVLVALCLRAPFAAVGPLLGELGAELSLSTGALAVVTALPLVCFGLVSPFAPALATRFGVHRAVLLGVVAIAAGVALRLAGAPGLYVGTVVLTGGIAVANVLLPAAARADYGNRSALVLGMIVASMAASASIGAGLAQPLANAAGSALTGLALWGGLVLAALVAMALLTRARRDVSRPAPAPQGARTAVLRDRVALAVTLFFGLQSLAFYSMLTWLAEILETEAGVSPVAAGGILALAVALGLPASLLVPPLAARRPGQGGWVLVGSLPVLAGLLGLLLAPAAAPLLWALLYGLGSGASFPLAMTLILQRTRDVGQTGRLSASAQSLGYLLAATGPLGIGLLHQATGGWAAGLVVLLVVVTVQLAIGLAAARPRLVGEAV